MRHAVHFILVVIVLLAAAGPVMAERRDYRLASPTPSEYETVATARLDIVFSDGVALLYALSGQDLLTRHDVYFLLYQDRMIAKIMFSDFWGKILKSRIIPTGVHSLPEGVMVEIAKGSYEMNDVVEMGVPWRLEHTLEPITEVNKALEYHLPGRVDLVISEKEMQIYVNAYTGLFHGEYVMVCNGLWKCLSATVRRTTDAYMYLDVVNGDARIFDEGEMIIVRDGPALTEMVYPMVTYPEPVPVIPDLDPALLRTRRQPRMILEE